MIERSTRLFVQAQKVADISISWTLVYTCDDTSAAKNNPLADAIAAKVALVIPTLHAKQSTIRTGLSPLSYPGVACCLCRAARRFAVTSASPSRWDPHLSVFDIVVNRHDDKPFSCTFHGCDGWTDYRCWRQ